VNFKKDILKWEDDNGEKIRIEFKVVQEDIEENNKVLLIEDEGEENAETKYIILEGKIESKVMECVQLSESGQKELRRLGEETNIVNMLETSQYHRIAQDRLEWARLRETYAQQRARYR
ncbi:hypothetical protein U1Q18_046825, partial [Sarracenia purpurea var. burkii]